MVHNASFSIKNLFVIINCVIESGKNHYFMINRDAYESITIQNLKRRVMFTQGRDSQPGFREILGR